MKLGKEEFQKMFLGGLLMVGLLYVYFNMLLGPLNTAEDAAKAVIHDRGPQVDADRKTIQLASEKKSAADKADATLNQVVTLIPDGSPVAWFPPLAVEFFKRQGIEKCTVHRGGEGIDKDLTGYKELSWGLDFSHVEITTLATAIAAFENEHPLMEIDTLQIQAGKDNVQYQTASFNVDTIIKQ